MVFKSSYFEEYLRTAASENVFMKPYHETKKKIKLVHKEFYLYIKETSENVFFYFMKETNENASFYFMIGFLWSLVCIQIEYFCDMVRNKLQRINIYLSYSKEDQKFKKRICHVNVVYILTNEKHFPKTISQ